MLTFTLAEFEESRKAEFKYIQSIFETLLERLEVSFTETNKKYDLEAETLMETLKESTKAEDGEMEEDWDGERREREREIQKEHDKEVNQRVELVRGKKIDGIKSGVTLTWIIYMRFTRRSQNIKAARLVFSKARKSELIMNHVYTASALMEFYVNKDPVVAGKIFELGMKTFNIAQDKYAPVFICRYIDFLVCLNDDNNTRALFERALAAIPADRSHPIWAKYINYETQYGDLTNLHKLQQRRAQSFPQGNMDLLESVVNVAEKWSCYDLNFIADAELGIPTLQLFGRKAPPMAHTIGIANPMANVRSDDKPRQQLGMLGGVHANKYPRPDLSKWAAYKCEPGLSKGIPHREPIRVMEEDVAEDTLLVPEPIALLFNSLPRRSQYSGINGLTIRTPMQYR